MNQDSPSLPGTGRDHSTIEAPDDILLEFHACRPAELPVLEVSWQRATLKAILGLLRLHLQEEGGESLARNVVIECPREVYRRQDGGERVGHLRERQGHDDLSD